jgi:hypothetical protein
MSQDSYNSEFENKSQAEETLRLLAELPPPAYLRDRVHGRLAMEQAKPARRGFWSLWMPAQRLQYAAAALLVVAVAGSTWSVYRAHPQGAAKVGTPTQAAPVLRPAASAGGFGSAGAERVPPTLNPIKVPPAPKKKPSASKTAKPSPKKLATQPAAQTPQTATANQ